MNDIDWTDSKIIAAIVTGLLAILGTVVATLLKRSRDGKRQNSILSKDVQQIQTDGNIHIGDSSGKPSSPKKKRTDTPKP